MKPPVELAPNGHVVFFEGAVELIENGSSFLEILLAQFGNRFAQKFRFEARPQLDDFAYFLPSEQTCKPTAPLPG